MDGWMESCSCDLWTCTHKLLLPLWILCCLCKITQLYCNSQKSTPHFLHTALLRSHQGISSWDVDWTLTDHSKTLILFQQFWWRFVVVLWIIHQFNQTLAVGQMAFLTLEYTGLKRSSCSTQWLQSKSGVWRNKPTFTAPYWCRVAQTGFCELQSLILTNNGTEY